MLHDTNNGNRTNTIVAINESVDWVHSQFNGSQSDEKSNQGLDVGKGIWDLQSHINVLGEIRVEYKCI